MTYVSDAATASQAKDDPDDDFADNPNYHPPHSFPREDRTDTGCPLEQNPPSTQHSQAPACLRLSRETRQNEEDKVCPDPDTQVNVFFPVHLKTFLCKYFCLFFTQQKMPPPDIVLRTMMFLQLRKLDKGLIRLIRLSEKHFLKSYLSSSFQLIIT